MAKAVIRLLRSPLREGEPPYTLGNIDQGVYEDGVHKGEKKPRKDALWPTVLEDGRLQWEIMDSEHNRGIAAALTAPHPNPAYVPGFLYSAEYPEDNLDEGDELEVEGDAPDGSLADPTPSRTKRLVRGRKARPTAEDLGPLDGEPKARGKRGKKSEAVSSGGE